MSATDATAAAAVAPSQDAKTTANAQTASTPAKAAATTNLDVKESKYEVKVGVNQLVSPSQAVSGTIELLCGCVSVYVSQSLSLSLSRSIYVSISIYLSLSLSISLFQIYLFVYLYLYLSPYLSLALSLSLLPFICCWFVWFLHHTYTHNSNHKLLSTRFSKQPQRQIVKLNNVPNFDSRLVERGAYLTCLSHTHCRALTLSPLSLSHTHIHTLTLTLTLSL